VKWVFLTLGVIVRIFNRYISFSVLIPIDHFINVPVRRKSMAINVGINGFGRIGRLVFRRMTEVGGFNIVGITISRRKTWPICSNTIRCTALRIRV